MIVIQQLLILFCAPLYQFNQIRLLIQKMERKTIIQWFEQQSDQLLQQIFQKYKSVKREPAVKTEELEKESHIINKESQLADDQSDSDVQPKNTSEIINKYLQQFQIQPFLRMLAIQMPAELQLKQKITNFSSQQIKFIDDNFDRLIGLLTHKRIFKITLLRQQDLSKIKKDLAELGKVMEFKVYGEWDGSLYVQIFMETSKTLKEINEHLCGECDLQWFKKAVRL